MLRVVVFAIAVICVVTAYACCVVSGKCSEYEREYLQGGKK